MILLIDMHHLAHRAHWAYRNLCLRDGTPTGLIYGSLSILLSLTHRFDPADIILCYDGGSNRRKEICTDYKATRIPLENGFHQQFSILKMLLNDLGRKRAYLEKEEADDVIASLAVKLKKESKIIIVSGDHDFFQLIDKDVLVLREGGDKRLYTEGVVLEKYGVLPNKLIDVFILSGDTSDNVKGIKRIGIKRASKLIREHGSVKNLIEKSKTDDKLKFIKDNEELLNLNRKLLPVKTDLEVEVVSPVKNLDLVKRLFKDYLKFNSFLSRWREIEKFSEIGTAA